MTTALDILALRKYQFNLKQKTKVVEYLKLCQHPAGGFAGAPYTEPHIASTYAAVCTLANLKWEKAYGIIDRAGMRKFLLRIKHLPGDSESPAGMSLARTTIPGSFQIHLNGENDMRATYCAMVVADLLNLIDIPELRAGVSDYIASCQTYEGGIACVPFGEAHAGYTYCGLATLILLGESHKISLPRLIEWASARQLEDEGGFNGRINKLVDSCYNFWVGAIFELADMATHGKCNLSGKWLANSAAVRGYTLLCCQSKKGGMIDKPGRNPDMYHTCYSLAGLSILEAGSAYQELYEYKVVGKRKRSADLEEESGSWLSRTHPVYGIQHEKAEMMRRFFRGTT